MQDTGLKIVQRNAYFAHPENTLVSMLGNSNEEISSLRVNKVIPMRDKLLSSNIPNDNATGGVLVCSEEEEGDLGETENIHVRRFHPPALNLEAVSYYTLVDFNCCNQQPPAIQNLADAGIDECRMNPLQLNLPYHNQSVERHVKLVTEASAQVFGFE